MLELRAPLSSDEAQLRAIHQEFSAEGEMEFLLDGFAANPEDFPGWLTRVRDQRLGINLPNDRVPSTYLLAVVNDEIVGRVSIRHELNDFLFNFGGHIGYMVRPEFRLKGYATEVLRQALLKSCELRLASVLVTCNDENIGSRKVIESQGGTLENIVNHGDERLRRYWINLG